MDHNWQLLPIRPCLSYTLLLMVKHPHCWTFYAPTFGGCVMHPIMALGDLPMKIFVSTFMHSVYLSGSVGSLLHQNHLLEKAYSTKFSRQLFSCLGVFIRKGYAENCSKPGLNSFSWGGCMQTWVV